VREPAAQLARRGSRAAAAAVLLALALVPAPLLPPAALVAAVQTGLGSGRAAAYLVAVLALQVLFYGAVGAGAALAIGRGDTRRRRWTLLAAVPPAVVGLAVLVRSLKLGHLPMLDSAAVPMVACALGTALAIAPRQHGLRAALLAGAAGAGALAVAYWPFADARARQAVERRLQLLVAAGPELPAGDARFRRVLQLLFAADPGDASRPEPIENACAAILALGIVVGHERCARFAGLDRDDDLVRAATALRPGTTLRGREDWARHVALTAARAVAESPFVGDLGGLLKEELDALTHGTGFSFGDLAADRAGVRFAAAATESVAAAAAAQARLEAGFGLDGYFPPVANLAENLTVEQFRRDYGGVGARRYREQVAAIEARLDGCAALRSP
jgi:hypothetical protein